MRREERRYPGGGYMQAKNFRFTGESHDSERFGGQGKAMEEISKMKVFSEEQTQEMASQMNPNLQAQKSQQWDPTYAFGLERSKFRWMVIGCASMIGLCLFLYLKPPTATTTEKSRNMHFFARLNADPSVTVTYSGLMYRVINQDTRKDREPYFMVNPDLNRHAVKIHYEGRLVDGTVFDSSYDSEPCVFPAESLIPGLTQGISAMTRGSEFEFFVPPHLAYGEWGSAFIPGHEPLVFRVKLVDFWKDAGSIREPRTPVRL